MTGRSTLLPRSRAATSRNAKRLVLLLAMCLAACAHERPGAPAGVYHTMRPGETLWRLSQRYGVPPDAIARANGIDDVARVAVGARLFVPGGRDRGETGLPPLREGGPQHQGALEFGWPVRGRVTSGYGRRGRRHHDGIDVSAPPGTPVRAAEAGRVIHSGRGLGDYGNTVIVKHAGRYSTVYAHNRANRVRKGEFVERGQAIAEVGSTGNASGPHLHFEIRLDDRSLDPLRYLDTSVASTRNP